MQDSNINDNSDGNEAAQPLNTTPVQQKNGRFSGLSDESNGNGAAQPFNTTPVQQESGQFSGLSDESNGNGAAQPFNTTPVQQESGQFSEPSSSNQGTQSQSTRSRENDNSPLKIFASAKSSIIDIFKDLLKNAEECENIVREPSSSNQGTQSQSTHSRENDNSPLKFFASAKSSIIDIFKDLLKNAEECENIVREFSNSKELTLIKEKIKCIKTSSFILQRNNMKVVFFGRTSNGKSTVINAMLRTDILPHKMGHTTSCFVQVEGTDSQEGYLYTEDGGQPQNINVIKQLADALRSESLQGNSPIRICYPKEKCRLLRENVVLVDSPGIDYEEDVDCWINEVCLDADVFVFVANSVSSISKAEKKFFVKLGMLKPNIFILQNKWDLSDNETEAESRSMVFLTEELKVASKLVAEQRIFFVSAKEVLEARLSTERTTPTTYYAERKSQFENFESHFETCISETAVKNKLKQYGLMGKEIVNFFMQLLGEIAVKVTQKINETDKPFHMKKKQLKELQKLKPNITTNFEREKKEIIEEIKAAFKDIIEKVPKIINTFEGPFSQDLDDYKMGLNTHLEDWVNKSVQKQYSSLVQKTQNTLEEFKRRLLPADKLAELNNIMAEFDVKTKYDLCIEITLEDFKADLNFKFFARKKNLQNAAKSATVGAAGALGARIAFQVLGASVGLGSTLAVTLPLTVLPVVGYYCFQKFHWIKTGKHKEYLQQYSKYAQKVLQVNVKNISAEFRKEVHEKMLQTQSYLQIEVCQHEKDLTEQIKRLDNNLKNLKDLHSEVMALKEKFVEVDKKLEEYNKDYFPTSETL